MAMADKSCLQALSPFTVRTNVVDTKPATEANGRDKMAIAVCCKAVGYSQLVGPSISL